MSKRRKSDYTSGKNPKSLENLIREGRPSSEDVYGEPKKRRSLTVTEAGWQGSIEVAKASGCSSVSEYLERLGRKEITSPQVGQTLGSEDGE